MSGDYSRQTFDALKDFSGVLMQQGRVQLDADWNELVEIIDRRRRAETLDTIGRAVVPKETPDGFRIGFSGGALTIGAGRMYVDGLLAENHGGAPFDRFDPVLSEPRGSGLVTYDTQPYFPGAAQAEPLPESGPHLVYLDVWQRELTALEAPEMVEKAVGVDTTTRTQTVWQVRVLPGIGRDISCSTPDDAFSAWRDLVAPSAARLSTAAVGVPSPADPCLLSPQGGYRGLENRLYRVEIHAVDAATGAAFFKWSRDNASVATAATGLDGARRVLTVADIGRDAVLRFRAGDWIEVTDDYRELAGKPGDIRRIESVDDASRTLTLHAALPTGAFPVDSQGALDPRRHTRVRRWDQRGEVQDADGNVLVNLDTPGSEGVIPVPASAGAAVATVLEDGVQVTFSRDPAGGRFRAGDYWVFAARSADGTVESLEEAPPRGVHHHYARLAIVTFPGAVTDCRVLWPPEFGGGEGCDCSVCVSAESHNSGALTIQRAIDAVKATGGTVCLGPGIYELSEGSVAIDGARSVKLRGHGWRTVLVRVRGEGPAMQIQSCLGLTVEELSVITPGTSDLPAPSIAVRSSAGVSVRNCFVFQTARIDGRNPAIGLGGLLPGTVIERNVFFSAAGLAGIGGANEPAGTAPLFTAGLTVRDNHFLCTRAGIEFGRASLHAYEVRLAENFFLGCEAGGISVLGAVAPGGGVQICGNELRVRGTGIVAGVDGLRIAGNNLTALARGAFADGIVLATGADRAGLDRCAVLSNQITGVPGAGISISARIRSAMIKGNIITDAGRGGIVMENDSAAGVLTIENNQLLNIAAESNDASATLAAMRVLNAAQVDVLNNTIRSFAVSASQSAVRAGIQIAAATAVRVSGNQLTDIGPVEALGDTVGIELIGTFERADVSENSLRRSTPPGQAGASSSVTALRVHARGESPFTAGAGVRSVSVGSRSFLLMASRLFAFPDGRGMLGVRGNSFETMGTAVGILIVEAGPTVLSENRCVLMFSRANPIVAVVAKAVIASANYLEGHPEFVTLLISVPRGAFTVLGNMVTSEIQVNGQSLPPPWNDLNARI